MRLQFHRDGMTFSGSRPTSDLEMMEQSVDDYIHEPQFRAYYMTFSGHIHAAVLIDHSFLTDTVWFNSNTGEIRYLVPQDQVPAMIVPISNEKTVSLETVFVSFQVPR